MVGDSAIDYRDGAVEPPSVPASCLMVSGFARFLAIRFSDGDAVVDDPEGLARWLERWVGNSNIA